MARFEMNKDWERQMEKVRVQVPADASREQRAEALAKEMKRKRLIK